MFRNCFWLLCLFSCAAKAQFDTCSDFGHFDLYLDINPPAVEGGKILIDPDLVFPLNAATGSTVVPADFGDFAGGPHKTDDPGWVIRAGDFANGDNLWFRGLGHLRYWDPVAEQWRVPPAGERVRYFGAIPAEVFIRNDPSELEFYRQGTIWTEDQIIGPAESPIDQAAIDGGIHTHLDFCVEAADGDCSVAGIGFTGSPATGAYLIELELFSDAGDGQKYRTSRPIQVLLNQGLSGDECAQAIEALIEPQRVDTTEALPGAGVLIMTGH